MKHTDLILGDLEGDGDVGGDLFSLIRRDHPAISEVVAVGTVQFLAMPLNGNQTSQNGNSTSQPSHERTGSNDPIALPLCEKILKYHTSALTLRED